MPAWWNPVPAIRPRPGTACRVGLTLLEILAITVLMGLVASALGAGVLLQRREGVRRDAQLAALRTGEQRIRTAMIGRGGILRWDPTELRAQTDAATWTEPLPSTMPLLWLVDGRPASQLIYDDRGRSLDAEVQVIGADPPRRYRINGLTGVWSVVADGPVDSGRAP